MGHVLISGNVPWNMWGKVAIKSFLKNWMDSTRYKRMQVVCRDMSCKCVSGMSFQLDTRTVQKCSYAFKEETSLLLILFIFEPSFSYLHFFPPESFQCGIFFSATQIRNLTKVIFKTQQRFFRPGKFQAKPEVPMGGPWRKSAIPIWGV